MRPAAEVYRAATRRRVRLYARTAAVLLGALLVLASAALAQMTPAAQPQDAVRRPTSVVYVAAFRPLAAYARWYAAAERCTGMQGKYRAVRWYVTSAPWSDGRHTGLTYGMWQKGHRITVNLPDAADSALVVHEVIHDLLSYHPEYPDTATHPQALYHEGGCSREFHEP